MGLRSEHFYYDGIRRIQEVVTDPVVSLGDTGDTGDAAMIAAANAAQAESEQPLDGDAAPLTVEGAQTSSASAPPTVTYLDREYVWGPGDRGVDELLCQYDRARLPWWTLQDEGGDVVALCDREPSTLRGRVVSQYTYDAYGSVVTAANLLGTPPTLRCGHKALFVDRLDVGVATSGYAEQPRLAPLSQILCQNRNRVFSPQLGRFLQADPNATGIDTLAGSFHATGARESSPLFDFELLYGNGVNRYAYLGSRPWLRRDPMGLEWQEDYEQVLLPIVELGDSLMPVSFLGPLDDLLQGYLLMIQIHSFVQGAAFDAEEQLDWALDWSASDASNPRFERPQPEIDPSILHLWGPGSPDLAYGATPHPNQVRLGARAEAQALAEHGGVKAKRMTYKDHHGVPHGRVLDIEGHGGLGKGHFMEVKGGKQGMTWRVRRQALIDMRLMRDPASGVKGIEWNFYVKDTAKPSVCAELLQFLDDCGIKYRFSQLK